MVYKSQGLVAAVIADCKLGSCSLKDRLKLVVGEIRFVGNLVAIGLDSKDLSTSAE